MGLVRRAPGGKLTQPQPQPQQCTPLTPLRAWVLTVGSYCEITFGVGRCF